MTESELKVGLAFHGFSCIAAFAVLLPCPLLLPLLLLPSCPYLLPALPCVPLPAAAVCAPALPLPCPCPVTCALLLSACRGSWSDVEVRGTVRTVLRPGARADSQPWSKAVLWVEIRVARSDGLPAVQAQARDCVLLARQIGCEDVGGSKRIPNGRFKGDGAGRKRLFVGVVDNGEAAVLGGELHGRVEVVCAAAEHPVPPVTGVLRWPSLAAFSTAAASVLSGAASLPALLSRLSA